MRLTLCTLAVLIGMSVSADAQTITSYTLNIYLQGATTPTSSTVLPVSSVQCGITPKATVTGTPANPSRVYWDDEAAPTTADCRWVDGGTGPILALPFNPTAVYTAKILATNAAGDSPESAASNPFSRPGASPAARTGVRVGG
jgi:hypothetical protein